MVSRDLKRKISQLTRERLHGLPKQPVAQTNAQPPGEMELRAICVPELPPGVADPACPRIEEIGPGRIVERPDGGVYWLIERRLTEIDPDSRPFLERFAALLTSEAILLPEGTSPHLAGFVEADPRRVLYLDIETTGLSGQPLFLVGVMEFTGDDFLLKQYFARDYAEEVHLMADLVEHLPHFDLLVTFNGRSFDVPFMRNRAVVNRLHLDVPPRHFDLLHESRRHWSGMLPNCKLVTLEQYLCRRRRIDDIPGALIPAAYHDYVHTTNADAMRHVIHHNALDLVTMAEIALYMLTGKNDWSM